MRSAVAAAAAMSVLYYVGAAAPWEQIRIGVVLTAVTAVAAVLIGLYGIFLAAPPKAKLWSWVSTATALLALTGFSAGQAFGWWPGT
ncbi:hypothetical protein [Planosporangium mesophilum]|uniref:Uncharacterized protein n=1 Tax=Planosporangium mesophilum TaxID=689768 RepID=A0A8J3TJB5_9ACTN|nr:hypothetical protein [Planosporangium mesophilum]NJC86551.1 hypothetical protein [Planosporangium mesophilum]GII26217.1 hypothetical protein Pme01_58140 [Planosporangium mesophilum]